MKSRTATVFAVVGAVALTSVATVAGSTAANAAPLGQDTAFATTTFHSVPSSLEITVPSDKRHVVAKGNTWVADVNLKKVNVHKDYYDLEIQQGVVGENSDQTAASIFNSQTHDSVSTADNYVAGGAQLPRPKSLQSAFALNITKIDQKNGNKSSVLWLGRGKLDTQWQWTLGGEYQPTSDTITWPASKYRNGFYDYVMIQNKDFGLDVWAQHTYGNDFMFPGYYNPLPLV